MCNYYCSSKYLKHSLWGNDKLLSCEAVPQASLQLYVVVWETIIAKGAVCQQIIKLHFMD